MGLARTFASFSSTDIGHYRLMRAWKAPKHIDFNFADFHLDEAINSINEYYIKHVCQSRTQPANTFALLIGDDTYTKITNVKWEGEVALEKDCRPIGVNLTNSRFKDWPCPSFFENQGAVFVPFSSRIIPRAMKPQHFNFRPGDSP